MNIYEKLLNIQTELKCNKSQYNSFGKYHYRSCEDILEAVKPICKKYGLTLVIGDEVANIGERFYIKATAVLIDVETGERLQNSAYAREELDKKGMSGEQVTGSSSSFARKYCLNGLFSIDDTKDADTDEYAKATGKAEQEWVRSANGVTEVLGNNGKWYALKSMNLESLNKIANDKKYFSCHNECRELMVEKSK